MNITIAAGLYPPEIGGPATYATMLEAELPSRGIITKVLPFSLVRSYPKVIRHLVYFCKLWNATKDADIIYALDPVSVGLPALAVSYFRRKPFLIRLGGDYAWEQGRIRFGVTETLDDYLQNRHRSPLPVKIFAKLQTYVVSRASRVIVPSEYLKSVVMKWGVSEESIQVIYSALYPLEVTGSRESLRHILSYTKPTIVSSGRLVPWKGFKVLIEIIADLKNDYPDITLVIIGDGDEKDSLEELTSKLQIKQHVRFAGSISKESLGAAIKAADVFVLNTAYEGLSHQLIEVMDIGTPIVTTKAGGNVELITNGVNGFLVDFNDASALKDSIKYILNHSESGERLVQSARGRSKLFTKEVVVGKIVEMLNEIHGQ